MPRIMRIAVWGVILLAYGCSFLAIDHSGVWIGDNAVKFIQMRAIMNSGFKDYSIPYNGQTADPKMAYVPLRPPFGHVIDGKLYAQYSPIFPAISALPYAWLGMYGIYILPLACGLLTIVGAGRLARSVAPDARAAAWAEPIAWVLTALATPIWFYSLTFWEHTPATALTTWGVVALVDHLKRPRMRSAAVAALLNAGSVYFRDDLYAFGAAVVVLLGVEAWRSRRIARLSGSAGIGLSGDPRASAMPSSDGSRSPHRSSGTMALLFGVVFAAACVPLWLFQGWALGSPLGLHFRAAGPLSEGWIRYLTDRWTVFYQLFLRVDPRLGVSLFLAGPCAVLWLWRPRVAALRFGAATAWIAAFGAVQAWVCMSSDWHDVHPLTRLLNSNALFSCSPVLLLALLRHRPKPEEPQQGEHHPFDAVLWLTLIIAAMYAILTPPLNTVGIHWGCRFILHIYPLWAALAATNLVAAASSQHASWMRRSTLSNSVTTANLRAKETLPGGICLAAVLIGTVGLQVYSLGLLRDRTRFSAEVNRVVCARPEHTVICTSWFVPQELFMCFLDREMFLVDGRENGDRLALDLIRLGRTDLLRVASVNLQQPSPPGMKRISDGRLGLICLELASVKTR